MMMLPEPVISDTELHTISKFAKGGEKGLKPMRD